MPFGAYDYTPHCPKWIYFWQKSKIFLAQFFILKTPFLVYRAFKAKQVLFWQALKHSSFSTIYPYRCKKMGAIYYRQQKRISSKVHCDVLTKSTTCSYGKWWNCALKSNYQNNESCSGHTCLIGWQDACSEQAHLTAYGQQLVIKVPILSNIPQSACMSICHIKSPPRKYHHHVVIF